LNICRDFSAPFSQPLGFVPVAAKVNEMTNSKTDYLAILYQMRNDLAIALLSIDPDDHYAPIMKAELEAIKKRIAEVEAE